MKIPLRCSHPRWWRIYFYSTIQFRNVTYDGECSQSDESDGRLSFSLISMVSFMPTYSDVTCTGTELVIVWLAVAMPTGSEKSTLCKFLHGLVQAVRKRCGRKES